jgi:hypothetical protein
MGNPAKTKGDKAEREAAALLTVLAPDLVVERPMRKLGAGRKDDTGDLSVLPDAAIQVKAWARMSRAIWTAATGAEVQAANGGLAHHVGMTLVPRARIGSVRWVMSSTCWPVELCDDPPVFGVTERAVAYLRDENGVPRCFRVALLRRAGVADIWLGTVEAWLAAYRRASASVRA